MTILIMLGSLHIIGALSRILEIHILGCVKFSLINILVQKGQLGISTACPQIKLLNKQLIIVQRWILAIHLVTSLMTDLKEFIGLQINQRQPKKLGEKIIEYDEIKVQKCVSIKELVSLSSGQQAPE